MPQITVDYQADTGNKTITWTGARPLSRVNLTNDSGTDDITVTIAGLVQTVKPGETLDSEYNDFTVVDIVAVGAWRMWLYVGRGI